MSTKPTASMEWPRTRLKYLADFRAGENITADSINETGEFPVYGGNGLRGYTDGYSHDANVVLLGRQGALCGNVNYASGKFWASEHAVVVMPKSTVDARWLGELLRSMDLRQYSMSAAQPGLSVEFIANLQTVHPPLDIQQRIAGYLDAETAEIDALIAEKERMLALLEEKRAAVVTHAVTRGLEPQVKLKPSGLDWLGDVPEHWSVRRLKFLIDGIDQGRSPQCFNFPAEEGQWGVLKTGCVNGGVFREQENKVLPDDIDPPEGIEVRAGDVLMSRASGSVELIGAVARVVAEPRARLLLSDKTFRLRPKSELLDAEFLVAVMGSRVLRHQIKAFISGAKGLANNIARTDIDNLMIPLPPVSEQKAIVDHLGLRNGETASLIDALRGS